MCMNKTIQTAGMQPSGRGVLLLLSTVVVTILTGCIGTQQTVGDKNDFLTTIPSVVIRTLQVEYPSAYVRKTWREEIKSDHAIKRYCFLVILDSNEEITITYVSDGVRVWTPNRLYRLEPKEMEAFRGLGKKDDNSHREQRVRQQDN